MHGIKKKHVWLRYLTPLSLRIGVDAVSRTPRAPPPSLPKYLYRPVCTL